MRSTYTTINATMGTPGACNYLSGNPGTCNNLGLLLRILLRLLVGLLGPRAPLCRRSLNLSLGRPSVSASSALEWPRTRPSMLRRRGLQGPACCRGARMGRRAIQRAFLRVLAAAAHLALVCAHKVDGNIARGVGRIGSMHPDRTTSRRLRCPWAAPLLTA